MGTQQASSIPQNPASEAQRAIQAAAHALNWDAETLARFEAGRALSAELRDSLAASYLPITRASQQIAALMRAPA